MCDLMLNEIKAQCKTQPKLRVVFLTSSWDFASRFRKDAVLAVCQDTESFNKQLETVESDKERDDLRKGREEYMMSVPKAVMQTYPSLDVLEEMVRRYLGISRTI
ncbi:hypothetical protein FNF27_00038 [Cafeteria roenbergensis]|uniref:Uncharacterized protein n=1 Tax=Cafeteria roenbergensis TaxID=33653 RepID=A0A5A8EJN9_CAFRO|nr:hypothetical protein FNF27_00038 [Cafeteria roenbergensis]